MDAPRRRECLMGGGGKSDKKMRKIVLGKKYKGQKIAERLIGSMVKLYQMRLDII